MFGDIDWPTNALRRFVSISWASCYPRDAQHSAVYATATWMAGCLSHAVIVSKRLNLS